MITTAQIESVSLDMSNLPGWQTVERILASERARGMRTPEPAPVDLQELRREVLATAQANRLKSP